MNVVNKTTNYTFIPYCYFLENPWFIEKDCHMTELNDNRYDEINIKNINKKNYFLKINNEIKFFDKKILCYNRRGHPHRRYLFYNFFNNNILYENSYISLNNNDKKVYHNYSLYFGISRDECNRMNEFFYNAISQWSFDGEDLNYNLANQFDSNFHKKTFVSLVSETSVSSGIVFFSEKTFKPIYACQPFILLGNPYSLKKLKEFGFKTFDKWWDESYDNEIDFTKRVEKIKKILYQIISKSDDELILILNEMKDILEHNFNNFLNYKNKLLLDVLSKNIDNTKNIKQLI